MFFWTTPFQHETDLLDDENPATAIVLGTYLLGVGIALVGTFFGRGEDPTLIATGKALVEGLLAMALLRLSIWVNNRFILYRFSIVKELREDRNLGTAICVGGSCIACGLIVNGALTGYSTGFLFGLLDVIIYWFIGQVVLIVASYVYARLVRYDVHQLIEFDDNIAVGIGIGALFVSLGIVLRASLVGSGAGAMGVELVRTLLLAVTGIVGVVLLTWVVPWLMNRKSSYEDEVEMHGNVAISVVTALATVASAILLAVAIQR